MLPPPGEKSDVVFQFMERMRNGHRVPHADCGRIGSSNGRGVHVNDRMRPTIGLRSAQTGSQRMHIGLERVAADKNCQPIGRMRFTGLPMRFSSAHIRHPHARMRLPIAQTELPSARTWAHRRQMRLQAFRMASHIAWMHFAKLPQAPHMTSRPRPLRSLRVRGR